MSVQNKSKFDHIIFFFLLLFLTKPAAFLANLDPRINIMGITLLLFVLIYLKVKVKSVNIKSLIISFSVVFFWIFYHYFVDSHFLYLNYSIFIINIYIGFLVINYYNDSIVYYFDKVIYVLSFISLIGWAIINIYGKDLLLNIPYFEPAYDNMSGSILIFTIPVNNAETFLNLYRNSGFAWEPGFFACMIVFAIMFRCIRIGKFLFFDKHIIIYIIALLTTMSTTGYVALLLFIGLYFMFTSNIKFAKKIILCALFVISLTYIFSLPFMQDKIVMQMQEENFKTSQIYYQKSNSYYCADRFEGISLDILNIKDKPFMGYGLDRNDSYISNAISPHITISDGLLGPTASMGIPLGVFLLILLYYSIKKICLLYGFKYYRTVFLVIIICSISYDFFDNPLMRALSLFCIFNHKSIFTSVKHPKMN